MNLGTLRALATLDDRLSPAARKMGEAFAKGAALVAAGGVAIGLAAGTARAAVTSFVEFEGSLNQVQAVSAATGPQIQQLGDLALEMGAKTKFSAKESADSMGFLAMAGLSVDQVATALPGTLSLAAAGNLQLAEAADIATNVLSGMGLPVEQLGRLNDTLAHTAANANTSVGQLGAAMKFVAPVASAAGLSVEETAAAIGTLGNAGIQGEMAGTALRGAITKLLNQSGPASQVMETLGERIGQATIHVTDASGKMLPFADVVDQLQRAGITAGEAMTVFGQRAGPGMLALVSAGAEGLRDFTGEIEAAEGAADRMAQTQIQGLYGSLTILKSAWDTLKITLGQKIAPAVHSVTEALTAMIGWVSGNEKAVDALAGILAGVLVTGIGLVVAALWTIVPAITAATGGLNLIIPVIGLVVGAVVTWRDEIATFLKGVWNRFVDALEFIAGPLVRVANLLGADLPTSFDSMKFASEKATEATEEVTEAAEAAEVAIEAVGSVAETSGASLGGALATGATTSKEAMEKAEAAAKKLRKARLEAIYERIDKENAIAAAADEARQSAIDAIPDVQQSFKDMVPTPEEMKGIMETALAPFALLEPPPPLIDPMMQKVQDSVAAWADDVADAIINGESVSGAVEAALKAQATQLALAEGGKFIGDKLGSALTSALGPKIAGFFGGPLTSLVTSFAAAAAAKIASTIGGAIKSAFSGGQAGRARDMGASRFRMTGAGAQFYVNGQWVDESGNVVSNQSQQSRGSNRPPEEPGAALGGVRRGLTPVGEDGMELVDFLTPARVYPTRELAAALAQRPQQVSAPMPGGGGKMVVQLVVDGDVWVEKMIDRAPEILYRRGQ